MLEIKFSGRGGQGVVMASQMLGYAFFISGKYPQCYSLFGGERRGAPVVSFLRVDDKKIYLKCEIRHPNELISFDSSLINAAEIKESMGEGSRILVNAAQAPECLAHLPGFQCALIDAQAISARTDLGHAINTAMLGAYCRFAGQMELEDLLSAIREMVPKNIQDNVEAARLGYQNLVLV